MSATTITCPCGPHVYRVEDDEDPFGRPVKPWSWSLLDCDGDELAAGEADTEEDAQEAASQAIREAFPEEPEPHCPVCGGTGVAHPATRWEPAERCDCDDQPTCRRVR